MRVLPALLMLLACDPKVTILASACELQIMTSGSQLVESGSRVVVLGHPLTTHFDTAAYFGGVRATVLGVDRDSCEVCDDCRAEAGCNICEDCDTCDSLCDSTCIETLTLVVPDLPPGSVAVQIYNSFGQSNSLEMEVVRSPIHPLDTAQDSGAGGSEGGEDSAQGLDSGQDKGEAEDTEDTASQRGGES